MGKKLSLIHLELGLALAARAENGEEVMGEMLAVYLAEPNVLFNSRKDSGVLDASRIQAACTPADEAAELLSDFIKACTRFSRKLQGSSEDLTPTKGKRKIPEA